MPHANPEVRRQYMRAFAKRRRDTWLPPSVETLRSLFELDADNGHVLKRLTKQRVGKFGKGGYRSVYVLGRWIPEHRLVWALFYGQWPPSIIDHINRVTSDNRPSNLRLAEPTNNQANGKLRGDNLTGVRGVSRTQRGWISFLDHGGQRVHAQQHNNIASAIVARRMAVKAFCVEFASKDEFSTSSVMKLKNAADILASNGCTAEQIVQVCDCHLEVANAAIAKACNRSGGRP